MATQFGWGLREDISWLHRSRLVPARKRWSESVGQYNVIERCLKYTPKRDAKFGRLIGGVKHHIGTFYQYLDMKFRWKSNPVEGRLKELIYKTLKATVEENKSGELEKRWEQRTNSIGKEDEIEFTLCVLLLHMATDICYHATAEGANNSEIENATPEGANSSEIQNATPEGANSSEIKDCCVLLSNYMVHLLITSPVLLPRGTGHIFFEEVCAGTTEFFGNLGASSARDACQKLFNHEFNNTVEGDRIKSFLSQVHKHAADELLKVGQPTWEKLTEAWIYQLFLAAAQCSLTDHADKLNQGGELLTHVWLLMAHFGLADLFRTSKNGFKGQTAFV